MKTLKERIEVEIGLTEGLNIQVKPMKSGAKWEMLHPFDDADFVFLWNHNDYRIKPEPLEMWVNVYSKNPCKVYYNTKSEAADFGARLTDYIKTIKVREVLE